MITYARIVDGKAVDIVASDPVELYHADIAAQFIVVPDGTVIGATYNPSTDVWTNPASPPPAPPLLTPKPPLISAVLFRNLFTIQEELLIAKSADPIVQILWSRFSDPKLLEVDMSLSTISGSEGALAYLANTPVQPAQNPQINYLAEGRMAEILTGVPK